MLQLLSPETALFEGSQSWSTAISFINENSQRSHTSDILDSLLKLLQQSGSDGFAYFHAVNAANADDLSNVKSFFYGETARNQSLMIAKYSQVSKQKKSDIGLLPSDCKMGSLIICPVFGPRNSKGVFIVKSGWRCSQISDVDLAVLNYILLRSQNYIAEIEAEQNIELKSLSNREKQVLGLMIKGASNKDVALDLGVSVHTVNGYVRYLMLKLDARDRVSACMAGLSILQ